MRPVIFVAPYFLDATLRFLDAVSRLDGAALAIVSTDPEERLPPGLRSRVHAHWRVDDCLDPAQIETAVRALAQRLGPPARLIGTLEELQVPLAEARARLGLPGLSVEAAANFRDKSRMKSVFEAHGLPCARHALVESAAAADSFANEVGFPLVVKPQAGAGARSTFRVDSGEQLAASLRALPPLPGRPVLLEEFVVGDEHSFDAVVIDGRPVWHSVSRYLPSPLEVLREPWIQWCVLLPRTIDGPAYGPIRQAGFAALGALGLSTGLAHMEWFRRADGSVAISEVGARPPGAQFMTLLSFAHDRDLYREWARLAVFDAFDATARKFAVGCAYLRGQGEGRVRAVRGLEEVAREIGPLVVEARLPEAGRPAKGGYEGDGHVIVRHPDTEVVERALTTIVSHLRVELVA
jgi:biotin carboxylase